MADLARVVNMECTVCGHRGDDLLDFTQTGVVGERLCPKCGSGACYIIKQKREVKHG